MALSKWIGNENGELVPERVSGIICIDLKIRKFGQLTFTEPHYIIFTSSSASNNFVLANMESRAD